MRNDGAVACFRPRIMSPSNRPDFYVVTSHRRSNHVNSPATRPMISHRLSPCFDFGVTDASEVLVWNRKALGGTRCILLEVSALGARDRLSTSHYRGRSPCPSQSPYGGGSPGVPSETWVRAVGDRWTRRSPRSFPLPVQSGLRGRRNATTSPEFMAAKPCTIRCDASTSLRNEIG